jgi:catechol-2,3-dioxygenase
MVDYIGAYAVIPAHDANRARQFYEQKVGLPAGEDIAEGFIFNVNGSVIYLYETQSAGKAEHTILSLHVTDLHAAVAELRSRGVVFEEYDFPGLKTVNGIANLGDELSAWFKDTEGNIVSVGQRTV